MKNLAQSCWLILLVGSMSVQAQTAPQPISAIMNPLIPKISGSAKNAGKKKKKLLNVKKTVITANKIAPNRAIFQSKKILFPAINSSGQTKIGDKPNISVSTAPTAPDTYTTPQSSTAPPISTAPRQGPVKPVPKTPSAPTALPSNTVPAARVITANPTTGPQSPTKPKADAGHQSAGNAPRQQLASPHPTAPVPGGVAVPIAPPSANPQQELKLQAMINRNPVGVLPGIAFQFNDDQKPTEVEVKRYVPEEITLVSDSLPQALAQSRFFTAQGFRILRRQALSNLDFVYSVFGTPNNLNAGQAKRLLQKLAPQLRVDVNHRYRLQGTQSRPRLYAGKVLGWQRGQNTCSQGVKIGLIDTGVDTRHPALQNAHIANMTVIPAGYPLAPLDHGTGVANLLLGHSSKGFFNGVLPVASMVVVSSFIKRPGQQIETTAEWLTKALDLLVGNKVQVINMSLGGGRDRLLDRALTSVQQHAVIVVAAAGNGGAKAAPVYPAAYPGVIAVTAIDSHLHVFRQANQGTYVEFAAPGVDVWSARAVEGGRYYSGTSFSTPFVTAAVAQLLRGHTLNIREIRRRLRSRVRDLGIPGRDPVFGYGLIQFPKSCSERS